jgi:hypothetical protein
MTTSLQALSDRVGRRSMHHLRNGSPGHGDLSCPGMCSALCSAHTAHAGAAQLAWDWENLRVSRAAVLRAHDSAAALRCAAHVTC